MHFSFISCLIFMLSKLCKRGVTELNGYILDLNVQISFGCLRSEFFFLCWNYIWNSRFEIDWLAVFIFDRTEWIHLGSECTDLVWMPAIWVLFLCWNYIWNSRFEIDWLAVFIFDRTCLPAFVYWWVFKLRICDIIEELLEYVLIPGWCSCESYACIRF